VPVTSRDIPYFLSRFAKPPTVDQLVAEMQEYEIPAANAKKAIDQAFDQGDVRWGVGATIRAMCRQQA